MITAMRLKRVSGILLLLVIIIYSLYDLGGIDLVAKQVGLWLWIAGSLGMTALLLWLLFSKEA